MKCTLCNQTKNRLFNYETEDGRESVIICEDCEPGSTLYDADTEEHYYEGRKDIYYYKGEVEIEPQTKKIIICCEGGLVQSVYASGLKEKFEVEIIDHDNAKCGDEASEAEYKAQLKDFESEKGRLQIVY